MRKVLDSVVARLASFWMPLVSAILGALIALVCYSFVAGREYQKNSSEHQEFKEHSVSQERLSWRISDQLNTIANQTAAISAKVDIQGNDIKDLRSDIRQLWQRPYKNTQNTVTMRTSDHE